MFTKLLEGGGQTLVVRPPKKTFFGVFSFICFNKINREKKKRRKYKYATNIAFCCLKVKSIIFVCRLVGFLSVSLLTKNVCFSETNCWPLVLKT